MSPKTKQPVKPSTVTFVRIPRPMWMRMKRLGKTDPQYKGTNAPVSRILVDLLNESLLRREALEGGKE